MADPTDVLAPAPTQTTYLDLESPLDTPRISPALLPHDGHIVYEEDRFGNITTIALRNGQPFYVETIRTMDSRIKTVIIIKTQAIQVEIFDKMFDGKPLTVFRFVDPVEG